ncbi:hypothetical protein ACFL4H_00100 [Candidatus Neomarinimicrobiota bacterium]
MKVKNRKKLIEGIKAVEKTRHKDLKTAPVLAVSNSCCKVNYRTANDIPEGNVKCRHNRWLIKYDRTKAPVTYVP